MNVTFVTGNEHKADKTAKLLGRELLHQKIELDEIQTTDLIELAEHKIRQAYEQVKKPVIIDDFGLGLDALSGLPGPFIKFFVEIDNGLESICRMVDGLGDRNATATCVIAFYDGKTLKVFKKILPGSIAQHPIGINGIHTDQIFIPDGYSQTRAELNDEEYDNVYRKVRPLDELKEFLDEYYG